MQNKNIKIFINWFLAPLIFVLLSISLYLQVINQPDLSVRWQQIKDAAASPMLWAIVLMMPLNWGLEAAKWRLLVSPLEKFGYFTAFKSVLAGCSITMLTPNRIGEYGGRILFVSEENRLKAISHNILGSMAQLFITLTMGIYGLIYLRMHDNFRELLNNLLPPFALNILLYVSVLAGVVLLLLYLRAGFIVKIINKAGVFKRFTRYVEHLNDFSNADLVKVLALSLLRYIVFIVQYMLLLKLLQVDIVPWLCFSLLTVFYLLMLAAPTIGFTELPIRAAASVQLLQLFSNNLVGIQAASLGIWIINLVIPAIVGSLLIFGKKIMNEKNEIYP